MLIRENIDKNATHSTGTFLEWALYFLYQLCEPFSLRPLGSALQLNQALLMFSQSAALDTYSR
ncbi:hypothetical protein HED50_04230 [Ochrobactrum oryzae]|nr:hypothetical protein [Brucella oryzae]